MHIIIGILAGIALLTRWLFGGWIARVLVFLLLAACSFALVADKPTAGVFAIAGTVLGWYISGIPAYVWRRRYGHLPLEGEP